MKKITKIVTAALLCLGLFATCLISTACSDDATTFEICNDVSNGIRAFQLLEAKGVISKEDEGDNFPVNAAGDAFTFTGEVWTSKDGKIKVTLVAENMLVSSMADYDYACLPCNTAYTGNVSADKRATKEDDPSQVAAKANIIAARQNDYNTNTEYKQKIDALTNAMLSSAVSSYFETTYLGAMTCDSTSQIDLRTSKDSTVPASSVTIKVCASDIPHAAVLEGAVKGILAAQGYDLKVTVLDWTLQNNAVANSEYDANYFQHVPYLESDSSATGLFAACKVHYEPLGIYYGKAKDWKF